MLVPSLSLFEVFLRGTLVYLGLLAMLRFARRFTGTVGSADLLTIVLVADAAQNALAADYKSLTEGAVLVATIVFWNYALDYLSYYSPAVEKLLQPPPVTLVRRGQILQRNMRRELITCEELMSHLREQGIERLEEVEVAYMEGHGKITAITRNV